MSIESSPWNANEWNSKLQGEIAAIFQDKETAQTAGEEVLMAAGESFMRLVVQMTTANTLAEQMVMQEFRDQLVTSGERLGKILVALANAKKDIPMDIVHASVGFGVMLASMKDSPININDIATAFMMGYQAAQA